MWCVCASIQMFPVLFIWFAYFSLTLFYFIIDTIVLDSHLYCVCARACIWVSEEAERIWEELTEEKQ